MIEIFLLKTEIDGNIFYLGDRGGEMILVTELNNAAYNVLERSAQSKAHEAAANMVYRFKIVPAVLTGNGIKLQKEQLTRYSNLTR